MEMAIVDKPLLFTFCIAFLIFITGGDRDFKFCR